ncbi:MAG: DUF2288 family protein [Myxococcota bacterium]|nr:DUF2288 family protein [Myxococcota bacterium]
MNKAKLREELEAQLGEANWGDLEPHAGRGALLFVSFEKELIDVAVAVALDQVEEIQSLLDIGSLRKPSTIELNKLNQDEPTEIPYIIVQPFVLARDPSRPTHGDT